MKKMLSVILATTLVLALTACGGKDNSASVNEKSQSETENFQKEQEDSVSQESDTTETIDQENPYTLEVQLTGEKTAEVKLEGVKIDTSVEGDIKDQNGIGEFIFSSNGAVVKIFFGKDRKIAEVYVGNDGAGFTRGESGDADNQTPVISGKFSAMAGTYKGDKSTLTIKEDGSFTYEFSSSSLQEIFNGQLSEGFKSGDKVQCGSNNIEFLFPEDYRYFSLVVWDANGNNMGGEDLSKQ